MKSGTTDPGGSLSPAGGPILAVALFAAIYAFSSFAFATTDNIQHPEVLAQRFVDAVTGKDAERRKEIVHPLTRACMNPRTQPYFDSIFSKQARFVTNTKPKVTVTPMAKVPAVIPTDGHSDYPIRPTHQIEIDFITDRYNISSVVLFVAHDGVQWREVLPCPRSDVIAQAKANQINERKQAERAASLKANMLGPLRAEIAALLKSEKKVDAILRYAAATGADIGTAKSVVELLMAERGQK
ncbi:MAG: hypothetical protein AB1768_20380 [Pseudomonadota bacterium]